MACGGYTSQVLVTVCSFWTFLSLQHKLNCSLLFTMQNYPTGAWLHSTGDWSTGVRPYGNQTYLQNIWVSRDFNVTF